MTFPTSMPISRIQGGVVGPLPACPAGEAVRRLNERCRKVCSLCLRPLPACPAGEAVRRLESEETHRFRPPLAPELLHLPDKPAGVEDRSEGKNSLALAL